MKKLSVILLTISILFPAFVFAGETVTKVGTTAAVFLEIMPGARPSGMGGAFVALADDASTLFFNPAGIARLPRNELILTHAEWLADMDFNYAGLVVPLGGSGTLGISLTSLTMPEMEVRTIEEPEGTGEQFSMSDVAMQLSYGLNLTDRFSIGFNGRFIQQQIWHMKARTFAIDIGTIYTTRFHGMRIGAVISNFGGDMKMEGKDALINADLDPEALGNNDQIKADLRTDAWSLPLNFQVGLALDLIETNQNLLTLTTDALHPNNNSESINLGLEYGFQRLLFLRAGLKNFFEQDTIHNFTLGSGIRMDLFGNRPIQVDYAFQNFDYLNNTHKIGLSLGF